MSHDGQGLVLAGPHGSPGLRAVCGTYLPVVRLGVAVDDVTPPVLALDIRGLPQSCFYVKNTGGNPITSAVLGWWVNDLEWQEPYPPAWLPVAPGAVAIIDFRRNATSVRLYLFAAPGAPTTADVAIVASGV